MWWHMPRILALGRLRQEDCKFKVSLGYTVRPYLKKKKNLLYTKEAVQPNSGRQ
jgi:hypothetical protein